MSTKDRIYEFIVRYTLEHLYPPSFKEICEELSISSKSTVFYNMHKLADEGKIELGNSCQPRCIKLIGYRLVKLEEDT